MAVKFEKDGLILDPRLARRLFKFYMLGEERLPENRIIPYQVLSPSNDLVIASLLSKHLYFPIEYTEVGKDLVNEVSGLEIQQRIRFETLKESYYESIDISEHLECLREIENKKLVKFYRPSELLTTEHWDILKAWTIADMQNEKFLSSVISSLEKDPDYTNKFQKVWGYKNKEEKLETLRREAEGAIRSLNETLLVGNIAGLNIYPTWEKPLIDKYHAYNDIVAPKRIIESILTIEVPVPRIMTLDDLADLKHEKSFSSFREKIFRLSKSIHCQTDDTIEDLRKELEQSRDDLILEFEDSIATRNVLKVLATASVGIISLIIPVVSPISAALGIKDTIEKLKEKKETERLYGWIFFLTHMRKKFGLSKKQKIATDFYVNYWFGITCEQFAWQALEKRKISDAKIAFYKSTKRLNIAMKILPKIEGVRDSAKYKPMLEELTTTKGICSFYFKYLESIEHINNQNFHEATKSALNAYETAITMSSEEYEHRASFIVEYAQMFLHLKEYTENPNKGDKNLKEGLQFCQRLFGEEIRKRIEKRIEKTVQIDKAKITLIKNGIYASLPC